LSICQVTALAGCRESRPEGSTGPGRHDRVPRTEVDVRGIDKQQLSMLSLTTPDKRVPTGHPLRKVKVLAKEPFGRQYSVRPGPFQKMV